MLIGSPLQASIYVIPPRESVMKVMMGIKYYVACLSTCAFAHNRVNLNHLGIEIVRKRSLCKLAKSFQVRSWTNCLGPHVETQQYKDQRVPYSD